MKSWLVLFALILPLFCTAQNRGNIWCFGDSAALDFSNLSSPIATSSSIVSRGSCVSIADTSGDLLFYAHTRSGAGGSTNGLIYNENHQLMFEGDSIAGAGWYQEMVIVPNPADDSSFYVFSVGVTNQFGLMYSIVDMRGDGGLGAVTQKNVQLLNFLMVDCILAVKHGNGRDWWIIVRKSPVPISTNVNNSWYSFLISPTGITAMPIQNIGSLNETNIGKIGISPDGSKLCFTNLGGIIELYDFDRCSGTISSPITIEPPLSVGPYPYYWSSEFSVTGQFLYVTSTTNPVSKLWQFDTWAPDIFASKTLIWQTSLPPYTAGALKRGPDDKIYLSCAWIQSNGWYYYPYDSSMYYPENMNLSVINSPDSAGLACDFQPWSFYLGGKRTYWGLPNNPDYDMPALAGSPCDTLVGINEEIIQAQQSTLNVYYSSNWQTAFINADKLKGNNCKLQVFDAIGKMVFEEQSKIQPPYYTKSLNCVNYKKGVYLVVLQNDGERLVKKFIVE
ncbi:MAG TPA: T9SS type A sorting domain-containing protein [Bacteroidia bacterium]|nr:T9SS type A sorting domain-containing protein [Bacteroidia bacterium]